ncbi:hypothetical protein M0802_005110 [Mischocyttarus mexicanus]|nr:hypothetical protein M0802_005110 [Mischocyttarus mexicanus]
MSTRSREIGYTVKCEIRFLRVSIDGKQQQQQQQQQLSFEFLQAKPAGITTFNDSKGVQKRPYVSVGWQKNPKAVARAAVAAVASLSCPTF